MATFAIQGPRHWGSSAAPCQVFTVGGEEGPQVLEAASQTYKAGQMVYADTSGNIAICGQSSSRMNTEILGFAMQDGANASVATEKTRVHVIRASDILVAQVWHSTSTSAKSNRNMMGDVFGLTLINPATPALGTGATHKWMVDIETTTVEDGSVALAKCRVVGFPKFFQGIECTIGTDLYAPVLIQIVPETTKTDGSGKVRNLQVL